MKQSESTDDIVVRFRGVSYAPPHASSPIIDNLHLEVRKGETLVLLGASGCGKTTTLRLVNRMLLPTAGEVSVEGRDTRAWQAISLRRRIGYVIQDGGLFPHFTVEQNVALLPTLEAWPDARVRERVRTLLDMVGLGSDTFINRYPHELSGGQRQRVGVARALAADPPLLLLDEPFGALDPLTRAALQKEFKELTSQLGKTVIFVTHDVREALIVGSRIGLMKAGRLVVLDTPAEFLNSDDDYARAYCETLRIDAEATETSAVKTKA